MSSFFCCFFFFSSEGCLHNRKVRLGTSFCFHIVSRACLCDRKRETEWNRIAFITLLFTLFLESSVSTWHTLVHNRMYVVCVSVFGLCIVSKWEIVHGERFDVHKLQSDIQLNLLCLLPCCVVLRCILCCVAITVLRSSMLVRLSPELFAFALRGSDG